MSNSQPLPGSERYREFLRDQAHAITASARQAGFFDHRPTSGTAREWVLRKPLEELLPFRYAVTGGQVLAADDSISTQWDVVIYDRLYTPRLYSTPGATILPIEGVRAVISVKSKVDKQALDETANAARTLRNMPRVPMLLRVPTANRPPECLRPPVFVFGFEGLDLPTLISHAKVAAKFKCDVINSVCVLDKGVILPAKDGNVEFREFDNYEYALTGASDGAWGIFVAFVWGLLTVGIDERPNLMAYVKMGELLDPATSSET